MSMPEHESTTITETDRGWPAKPLGGIPEFDSAIRQQKASFNQVLEAYFYSQSKFEHDEDTRRRYASYYESLHHAFEHAHGSVLGEYFCEEVVAGAVYTDRGELETVTPLAEVASEIRVHLSQMTFIGSEATEFLSGHDRQVCVKKTYDAATMVLAIADARARARRRSTEEPQTDRMPISRIELAEVERATSYVLGVLERNAQFRYVSSMVISAGIIVGQ
jgi:hypothetical protein